MICRIVFKRNGFLPTHKDILIKKDLVLIVSISITFGIIILAANLFKTEYNTHIIFNILFILFVVLQVCFDFNIEKSETII